MIEFSSFKFSHSERTFVKKLAHQAGFTYIGLMLIIAIAGIALSGVGIVWHTEMQRENELELQYIGKQYAAAIGSYYECKLCGAQQYPKALQDLLKDNRQPSVLHHIRKLYRDPMTRSNDWGLVRRGGRIVGVYSKSKLQPLTKSAMINVLPIDTNAIRSTAKGAPDIKSTDKKTKITYQSWLFVYEPGGAAATTSKPADGNTNSANAAAGVNASNNINSIPANAAPVVEPDAEPEPEPEDVAQEDPGKACDLPYETDSQSCSKQCQSGASPSVCNACFKEVKQAYDECKSSLSGR